MIEFLEQYWILITISVGACALVYHGGLKRQQRLRKGDE